MNTRKSPSNRFKKSTLFCVLSLFTFCLFFPDALHTTLRPSSFFTSLDDRLTKFTARSGISRYDSTMDSIISALTPRTRLGENRKTTAQPLFDKKTLVPPAPQTEGTLPQPLRLNASSPLSVPVRNATEPAVTEHPPASPDKKVTVLLTGDSMMMEGLGPALLRELRQRQDMETHREAVYSTGLSRKDYFDWPAHMATLVETFNPGLVIICIGGNDAQDIVDQDKKRHLVGSQSWQEEYGKRAEQLAQAAQTKGAQLIWVGLPILGKEPQAANTKLLTKQQQLVCAKNATSRHFVDTYGTLADKQGRYATFLSGKNGKNIRIRAKDKVHVTPPGGIILAQQVLSVIAELYPYSSESEHRPPPSGNGTNIAPLPDKAPPPTPTAGKLSLRKDRKHSR